MRLVRSEGLLAERRAKRSIYSGYGMPSNEPWFRRLGGARAKNTGNTSVVMWQERLLALMEACRPTELEPDTLATFGERDLDGAIVKTFRSGGRPITSACALTDRPSSTSTSFPTPGQRDGSLEPFYQWHFVNAFERGREIVVDYVRYPDFSSNEVMADMPSREPRKPVDSAYHRAVIDPAAKTFTSEPQWDVMCDFPRIASDAITREHRFAYLANYSRANLLGHFDELFQARHANRQGHSHRARRGAVSIGADLRAPERCSHGGRRLHPVAGV